MDSFQIKQFLKRVNKAFLRKVKMGERKKCPVCDRYASVQTINLDRNKCEVLEWIVGECVNVEWVRTTDGPRFVTRGNPYSYMVHFGLVETKAYKSGLWRPTELGKRFFQGTENAPAWYKTYNNKVIEVASGKVSFSNAMTVKGRSRDD